MDFQKQFSQLGGQIRDLFGKLGVSQKITIGLLGIVVASVLIGLLVLSRGESWARLAGAGDPNSIKGLKSLLDQNGVPYRISTEGGGAIEVPKDRIAHARWLAAESGVASMKDTNLEWLFGEGSLLDTEKKLDQRLLESRKRTVEDTIRWSSSIRDARIVIQRGPDPIYANRTASADSAAVAVALRPGVEGLTRQEAAAIRTLAAGAFNIPAQNIQITDDRLRSYPHLDGTVAGMSEEEDRTRRTILSTVESLLGRIYRPSEFVVGVLVDLSTHRSQISKETFDPEKVATGERSSVKETETNRRGPGGPVGVEPNVAAGGLGSAAPVPAVDNQSKERKETTSELRFSSVLEKTEIPAGEVKGLSVNVVLDRAAVRRILQAEEFTRLTAKQKETDKIQGEADIANFTISPETKPGQDNLDQAIEAYRRNQADFLKEQIPMTGAKVNVSAVMFPKAEMPQELAASPGAGVWAREHWSEILVGGISALGLLVVWRMFRQAVPPPIDVPTLDESVLAEEERAGMVEIQELEAEIADLAPRKAGSLVPVVTEEASGGMDEFTTTVQSVKSMTKTNPEMASAVVRMWMNRQGDGEEGKE